MGQSLRRPNRPRRTCGAERASVRAIGGGRAVWRGCGCRVAPLLDLGSCGRGCWASPTVEEADDEGLGLGGVDPVGVVEAFADAVLAEGVDGDDLVAAREQQRPAGVAEAGTATAVGAGRRRDKETAHALRVERGDRRGREHPDPVLDHLGLELLDPIADDIEFAALAAVEHTHRSQSRVAGSDDRSRSVTTPRSRVSGAVAKSSKPGKA